MNRALRGAAVLLCIWGLTPVYGTGVRPLMARTRGSAPITSQQPRDNRITAPVGDGAISGVIVTTERTPKPLRRARVMLTGGDLALGETTITADDGTFVFDRLPAGRYGLAATKDGYVTMSFGAAGPNRTGTRIALAARERRSVSLALPKGAVITGLLSTDEGHPLAGITVMALTSRYVSPPGERLFARVESLTATTDDRGVYRIFGLPAGEYIVMAQLRPGPGSDFGGELQQISAAEVRRALSEVGTSYRAPSRPGPPPGPPAAPAVAEPRRSVAFAPVYYPGTALIAQARPVTLAAAEERRGIDFVADYVPTATVQGYVTMMDGSAPPRVLLIGQNPNGIGEPQRSAPVDRDGRFAIAGVTPGTYTVVARSARAVAFTQVTVSGDDLDGVSLALQPAFTIGGRIEFEGSGSKPTSFPVNRLSLPPALIAGGAGMQFSVELGPDGTFRVPDVTPGPLRFFTRLQGMRRPIGQWWLKSLNIRGRDVLDAPLEFRESVDDAVITFTDRVNELAGRVNAPIGDPGPYVVVFSVDRSRWFHQSRGVDAIRPGQDGRYSVKNLPAGDYYVALVNDIENMEWFDPIVLDSIAPKAARVTVTADGVTAFDVSPMK